MFIIFSLKNKGQSPHQLQRVTASACGMLEKQGWWPGFVVCLPLTSACNAGLETMEGRGMCFSFDDHPALTFETGWRRTKGWWEFFCRQGPKWAQSKNNAARLSAHRSSELHGPNVSLTDPHRDGITFENIHHIKRTTRDLCWCFDILTPNQAQGIHIEEQEADVIGT